MGAEYARHRIFLATEQREVHLPDIGDAWRTEKHFHRLGWSSFTGAVVHDRSSRMQRVDKQVRIRISMTSKQIQIHRAPAISRAHQVKLSIQGQVAQNN